MKGKRVNPQYRISKVIPLKLLQYSSPVFVENENASEAAWTVHVIKIRVTGLAISRLKFPKPGMI